MPIQCSSKPTGAESHKPGAPVSNRKLVGELIAGAVATAVADGLSYVLFVPPYTSVARRTDCMGGFQALALWVFLFCPIILPSSAATAVYLVGKAGDQTGSFPAALGLSFLGGFLAVALALLSESMTGAVVLVPLGSALGAAIGFNLTRRQRYSTQITTIPQFEI